MNNKCLTVFGKYYYIYSVNTKSYIRRVKVHNLYMIINFADNHLTNFIIQPSYILITLAATLHDLVPIIFWNSRAFFDDKTLDSLYTVLSTFSAGSAWKNKNV